MLELTRLKPLGAVVSGLRIDALDDEEVHDLRLLLAHHGVIVLPGQDIDDHTFLRFLRNFGPTVFTVGETPVPGFPDLNLVSNVGRARPPRSTFHTDTSYVRNPPAYTALRAVQVPEHGGQTLFADQYAAYETLPPDVRDRLRGCNITHIMTGLDVADSVHETRAVHPIFLRHPLSGRTALYLSTPQRCAAVSGMPPDQAAEAVSYLFDHSTREHHIYRHAWSEGDIVMWDNRCVLHRADHNGVTGDRVMHRGMVAGHGGLDSTADTK
ncbi:MAG: taurine dioxygenase [Mycobacterium sp.]|jgi:taurine dioxygenase|nr:taurine dioxygenase [Mycobacterium sp.]